MTEPSNWRARIGSWLILALATAIVANVVWQLLAPIWLGLIALIVVVLVISVIVRGAHYRR